MNRPPAWESLLEDPPGDKKNGGRNVQRGHRMQAAVVTGPESIRIEEIPRPQPATGEVRVRLEGCGLCASSLPVWEGRPWFSYPLDPGMPGHEGWGVIDAVGPGATERRVGDRVAFLSSRAFAQFDIAREKETVLLPSEIDEKPFPGEPLGCAMNILARSDICAGQWVAVIGVGFLGALLIKLASRLGARVIALSQRPFSLEIARRSGAVETVPLGKKTEAVAVVKRLTGGELCDRVIEATGFQAPLEIAGELTRVRGRLAIAGFHQDGPRQIDMQLWNWRGLDVINAHERDSAMYVRGMREAIRSVAEGDLNPFPLFTHTYEIADIPLAFRDLRDRPNGFLKGLIVF